MNHNFLTQSVDTDAITFCKQDHSLFSKEEIKSLIKEINDISPEFMVWEDDGYYDTVIVLKAKNYVLWDGKKLIIKGSGLRSKSRELRLREFIHDIITMIIDKKESGISILYHNYVKEISCITDIETMTKWTTRKTYTEKTRTSTRTNETKIIDAIGDKPIQDGDKVFVYFDIQCNLKMIENWNGDHNQIKLLEKLWKTLNLFSDVLDTSSCPKYHTVKGYQLLTGIVPPKKERKKRTKKEKNES